MDRLEDVQQKYDYFLRMYNKGIEKHVPYYKVRENGNHDWFNANCYKAKKKSKKINK